MSVPEDVWPWYSHRREQYLIIDAMSRGAYPNFASEV